VRALAPSARVHGCEVATSTPLTASFAAGQPVTVERLPSFVDGIGGRSVLPEMWPLLERLLDGAFVASVEAVSAAVRLLVERVRVVAEGAGATPVAVALGDNESLAGRKVVCVVSGGNIDTTTLIGLLHS
jgi:threonine dehydratase